LLQFLASVQWCYMVSVRIVRAREWPSSAIEWESDHYAFVGVVWVGEPPPLRRGLTREGMKAAFDCQGEGGACIGWPDLFGFDDRIDQRMAQPEAVSWFGR